MKLIGETSGARFYESEDGASQWEVRAQLYCMNASTGKAALESFPQTRTQFESILRERLDAQIAIMGGEPFGEVTQWWTDELVTWEPGMLDEDGEPLPEFEPWTLTRCHSERGFWPTPPKEGER